RPRAAVVSRCTGASSPRRTRSSSRATSAPDPATTTTSLTSTNADTWQGGGNANTDRSPSANSVPEAGRRGDRSPWRHSNGGGCPTGQHEDIPRHQMGDRNGSTDPVLQRRHGLTVHGRAGGHHRHRETTVRGS